MAGEHKVKPLPFALDALKGFSKQLNEWHHDTHYAGYVNKRNEIEIALETIDKTKANANYSQYGELKRKETFNASGQLLHELYWDNLGGDGKPSGEILKAIESDFGSFEKWKADFLACAKASTGWAILCLDKGKMRNFLCDSHNQGAVWGANPILALDVFEHAYYHDYGPNRGAYLEAFMNNIDWKKADSCFSGARG
ncbi:MAG: Fe-Mn family superoxide dismutase [Candidatus Micrarchaeota archaeon]